MSTTDRQIQTANNANARPTVMLDNILGGTDSGPISEKDWTGLYAITLLVVRTRTEAVRSALPGGLTLDESYGSDGWYPIVIACGAVQNARPRFGGAIGFNYLEIFSAIPGVQMQQPNSSTLGPYLYPHKGYLNHLIPVVLGRLSGFPKFRKRVSSLRSPTSVTSDGFRVNNLISGEPLLSGKFTLDAKVEPALANCRVQRLSTLLPPDIVGVTIFGKLVCNSFEFYYDQGTAENVDADIQIDAGDFIPGISNSISYNDIAWFDNDDRYRPVRLFVPWRLREKTVLNRERSTRLMPAIAAKTVGREPSKVRAAAAAGGQQPKPGE
jgi:hypothetical protein